MWLSLRLRAFARNSFLPVFGALVLLWLGVIATQANERSRITISVEPGEVRIEAQLPAPARSWSFRNAYAGVLGIADRVDEFRATGDSGQDARVRKSAAGEYRSALDATRIAYTVKLSEFTPANVSHVSWLAADRGFLMFADLMPRDLESLIVDLRLPAGWTAVSSISPDQKGQYEILAPEKAVFVVGNSVRRTANTVDGMDLDLALSGRWPFNERAAADAAVRVMKKYVDLTGFRLPGKSSIMIAPLPVKVGSTKWRAETRGSTVVLLIEPAANFRNWIGQLGVIFTHELLHLWVPNSLRLEGDYDWFFEGFTLYTALRTALELRMINFKEYLDTLARVYDSYLSYADDSSLIEASERRWTTVGSVIYDKGMLVAFLYDLKIRKESGGRTTLADRYRELFSGRLAANANGNEVIIALLDSAPAMSGFARRYVDTSTKLELEQVIRTYGLTLDSSGKKSQLRVSGDLNTEQKQLLRSLGYRD